ncbi:MAG: hypothetical protein WCK00_14550 [Deltaproteobacteria bacterium]
MTREEPPRPMGQVMSVPSSIQGGPRAPPSPSVTGGLAQLPPVMRRWWAACWSPAEKAVLLPVRLSGRVRLECVGRVWLAKALSYRGKQATWEPSRDRCRFGSSSGRARVVGDDAGMALGQAAKSKTIC